MIVGAHDTERNVLRWTFVGLIGGLVASVTPFLIFVPFIWIGAAIAAWSVLKGMADPDLRQNARRVFWVLGLHGAGVLCLWLGLDYLMSPMGTVLEPKVPDEAEMQAAATASWIWMLVIGCFLLAGTWVAIIGLLELRKEQ